jgi:anaerobic magnesium-protoporphyrin IX monomethyl ester cyclase
MRYDKVLFVKPKIEADWRGIRPHVGLGYLAEALVGAGIDYDILDLDLGHDLGELEQKINSFQPALIGVPLISFEYLKQYELLHWLKSVFPKIPIVVGGPHVTILKDRVLNECPAIDFGITFEGEIPLVELCLGEKKTPEIQSLLYRADLSGTIAYTGNRPPNRELDKLSFPKYEKFEMHKYITEKTIYSSRGCPHLCIFCPNRLFSPIYRPRSAKSVVDEMEYWYKRGDRQFNFDDDNFNFTKQRVFDICNDIEKRGMKNLFIRCANGIRADRIDRETLVRMRQVGFHYIAIGADAGNNRMLKIVKKGETIEQIEEAVKNCCELGYDVKLLFVVGTPYETWEDVEDKVRLARKYPLNDVHFYNTIPYPGTELYDWVEKNGYFLIDPKVYLNNATCLDDKPVFETPELPAATRIKLYKYLKGVRREVHRKAFQRMYPNHKFLSWLTSYVAVSDPVIKLFYQNMLVRSMVEKLRYKRATIS